MKKARKILIILIYIITVNLVLISCQGGHRIQDLAMVTAIGIDKEDDQMIITCEIANPGAGNSEVDGGSSASIGTIFAQGVGNTSSEAIRRMTLYLDKKLFFSHATIFILGEDFAKDGITGSLDLFLRNYQFRENMYIIIAKECKAYEIMGVRGGLSESVGKYLVDILDNFGDNGRSINISIYEYYRYYYDIANHPVIGAVKIENQREIQNKEGKGMDTKKVLNVGGGSALKGDRLLGYFTEDEMIGFNFIVGDTKGGLITFKTPGGLEEGKDITGTEGQYTSIEILKSKTKNLIKIIDEKIHLDINIKLKVALREEEKAVNLKEIGIMNIIEKACSKEVERIISKTLNKGQKEFKNDNFSIGVAVHQQYPKLWKEIEKDWENIFPDITYNVNVETDIVKVGIINVPANLRRVK